MLHLVERVTSVLTRFVHVFLVGVNIQEQCRGYRRRMPQERQPQTATIGSCYTYFSSVLETVVVAAAAFGMLVNALGSVEIEMHN